MKISVINTVPCIIFKNSTQSDKVYAWVYDAGDRDGHEKGKKALEKLDNVEIISDDHGAVKGIAQHP